MESSSTPYRAPLVSRRAHAVIKNYNFLVKELPPAENAGNCFRLKQTRRSKAFGGIEVASK
jgi:hypothetical protein